MFDRLEAVHPTLPLLTGATTLVVAAVIADLVVKQVLLRLVGAVAKRTVPGWADTLLEAKIFSRLAQVVPALIIYSGVQWLPGVSAGVVEVVRNVMMGYVVLMLTLAVSSSLSAANRIYETYPISRMRPLRGFVQIVQIAIYVFGTVLIIAALLDRSPLLLLSGVGAMTAVLLLVFKDTILGLVASVQLTAHDMVRVGDWVQMDKFGADGDVVEVSLHTVKVQNFDKTITTIPTHFLISDSFQNWRGMQQAGGRRIKRAVHIDQASIRFLAEDEIATFREFALLADYVETKQAELERYAAGLGDVAGRAVNRRRLTNVGTFRAYVYNYLKSHPLLRDDLTLLVRQLPPGPEGLPIELYCFTNTTVWGAYEGIQADIFDHILAIVPEFGLNVFQKPSGRDVAMLRSSFADTAA